MERDKRFESDRERVEFLFQLYEELATPPHRRNRSQETPQEGRRLLVSPFQGSKKWVGESRTQGFRPGLRSAAPFGAKSWQTEVFPASIGRNGVSLRVGPVGCETEGNPSQSNGKRSRSTPIRIPSRRIRAGNAVVTTTDIA